MCQQLVAHACIFTLTHIHRKTTKLLDNISILCINVGTMAIKLKQSLFISLKDMSGIAYCAVSFILNRWTSCQCTLNITVPLHQTLQRSWAAYRYSKHSRVFLFTLHFIFCIPLQPHACYVVDVQWGLAYPDIRDDCSWLSLQWIPASWQFRPR